MKPRIRKAFTLTELLIVMAILSLMGALVVPSVLRIAGTARSTKCLANLKTVGQAYYTYNADRKMQGRDPMSPYAWVTTLTPYMGNQDASLLCPEDLDPHITLPPMDMFINYDGGAGPDHQDHYQDIFPDYPHWEDGPFTDEHESLGVWKLNDQDYEQFMSDPGTQEHATGRLPQYSPGEDPDSFWLVFEEGINMTDENLSDYDYNDFSIHFEKQEGNFYKLTFMVQWAWTNYNVTLPDGTAMTLNLQNQDMPTVIEVPGDISYGMNWRVGKIAPGSEKILALDYNREVAHVGGRPASLENWSKWSARRHFGKINILRASGGTETVSEDEISPVEPNTDNDETFWDPKG
jgi:prepilin-type N-terminal cleavage/methylation domain-containing protein